MKKESPEFSIIVPVYNVAPWLPRCLNSIMRQDFADWEAIVVDDGSTDSSGRICDEYAALDPRFKVMHKENGGVSTARNTALSRASGKWIWFVDSDDYIATESLSRLNLFAEKTKADTIFFGHFDVKNDAPVSPLDTIDDILHLPKDRFLEKVESYFNPTILFSRALIEKNAIRFTPGIRMAEDLEFQYKYLIKSNNCCRFGVRLYAYCRREGSAVNSADTASRNAVDCLAVAENLLHYAQRESFSSKKWFCRRIRTLLKSGMQSGLALDASKQKEMGKSLAQIVRAYRRAGYGDVADSTIRLAITAPALYYSVLKWYLKRR